MLNSVDLDVIPAAAGFIVQPNRTTTKKVSISHTVTVKITASRKYGCRKIAARSQAIPALTESAGQNFLRTRSRYLYRR